MVTTASAAYASCERRARAHYENFPVASFLLPARMRPHVAAVYAFARVADDFADEGAMAPDERLRLLEHWHRRLDVAASGGTPPAPASGEPADAADIFLALRQSMRECALSHDLFADLLSAFEQDVTCTRYPHWDALFDYARRSANPVGRLVLRIAGYRDARLDEWSDAICTALQFTNFWQDLEVDYRRGRVYLPQSELARHGGADHDLGRQPLSPGVRRSLQAAIERTRQLFETGRPLCDAVRGRLRFELRATWLGGVRILDRVEAQLEDPQWRRPALGLRDLAWVTWRTIAWPFTSAQGAAS